MAYQKLSKVEKNRRARATQERNQKYIIEYNKKKYKFINIQFRLDDEKDKLILDYLEGLSESRASYIKSILYKEIKKESNN